MLEAFKVKLLADEQSLKSVYKSASENLSHPNKELRDMNIELIKCIYISCDDDLNIFIKHLKNLRPV